MKPFLTLLIAVTFVASFSTALAKDKPVNILILGDSLSAGLGVTTEQAYPSLVQQMFNQKTDHYVNITNGSISGSTSAGAVSRLKWFLRIKPDILILALGANDGLRGLSTQLMTQNLESANHTCSKASYSYHSGRNEDPAQLWPKVYQRF